MFYCFLNLFFVKIILVAARKGDNSYVEIIIGILTAVMMLLLIVFTVVLVLSKRHKFQGSPTFFKNPFGVKINMKVNKLVFLFYLPKNVQISIGMSYLHLHQCLCYLFRQLKVITKLLYCILHISKQIYMTSVCSRLY